MGFEHEGPAGANFRDSSCAPQAVQWEDGEEVRRWLEALGEAVKDLRAAGRDRARPKRRRVLSRHEAGRQLGDAWSRAARLLRAGEAGLGRIVPCEPEPAPEGGPEDEPPFSSHRPTTPSETAS
jgi:hypothetical protein